MMVSGISSLGSVGAPAGGMGMNQASDPVSRDLTRQIEEAQKKLQELSSNEDLSMEEKMKKRQELQKQISDLNSQLRQHQVEQRREAAEKNRKQETRDSGTGETGNDQKAGSAGKGGQQAAGLSTGSMQAMISADGSMKQAKVQGSVAKRMEGRAGVLEAEIKLDAGRGGSTGAKEKELAEVKEKAANATASQMSTLSEANKEVEKAGETGESGKKEDPKASNAKSSDEKEGNLKEETEENAEKTGQAKEPAAFVRYTPVDIRL